MNTVRIPNPNFSEKIFHNPVLARLNNSNPQERREIQRRLALDYNQLRSVGEINEPATQIFRSYLLQEGATTSNSSGGKPQSMVYGLIDPEEAVIAINTPQGATKFSNIVHNAILTNQENANMHGNPIDDLKYTGYQVIIGDPGEPATAIRQQVKDFNIVGDQVKLTVIPNIIYPKSPQVLQYANYGIEDPRYHLGHGGRTGESIRAQRMVRGTTIYPHAEDVYEFQLNQYPLHLVTIDPKIFTEPRKSFISERLRYLLDRLSANK